MTRSASVVCLFLLQQILQTSTANSTLWQPTECNRTVFLQYNGCNKDAYTQQYNRCKRIKELVCMKYALPSPASDQPFGSSDNDPTCLLDMMLSPHQAQMVIRGLEQELLGGPVSGGGGGQRGQSRRRRSRQRRRRKRTAIADSLLSKWKDHRVDYKVDGNIVGSDFKSVMDAIQLWESETCLKFVGHDVSENISDSHLLFTFVWQTICSSYIGRVDLTPQPLYLGFGCFYAGIVAHEIGHALGLVHEHQRYDRSEFVRIQFENAVSADIFLAFNKASVNTFNVSYDYASDMQYRALAFSSNGLPTILALDEQHQSTIGQRQELSFWDVYGINTLYCKDLCQSVNLPRPCSNHGYQDPKRCDVCRCPDGLGGQFCEDVRHPENNVCSGKVSATEQLQWVTSPGYDNKDPNQQYYDNFQECNYLIESPPGSRILVEFQGDFGIYCWQSDLGLCVHWVEVQHNGDLGMPGPRFCCNKRPDRQILSTGSQVLIVFKSESADAPTSDRRGFNISYQAGMSTRIEGPSINYVKLEVEGSKKV